MNVLTNRRDITAQREAQHHPPQGDAGALAALVAELSLTNRLLERNVREFNAQMLELAVTDREPAQLRMKNFPVPGCDRLIVRRAGAGGTFTIAATTSVLVCAANENRLGGKIVNSGTGAITLFISVDLLTPGTGTPLPSGAAQIFLPPGNPATATGSVSTWDFLLGRTLWCGNVIAFSTPGSTLTVAEI